MLAQQYRVPPQCLPLLALTVFPVVVSLFPINPAPRQPQVAVLYLDQLLLLGQALSRAVKLLSLYAGNYLQLSLY